MHQRLLQLAKDTRFSLTLTILTGLMTGILTIWQAWLLSNIVNDVFLESQTLFQVWNLLRLMLFVISGRALLTWLSEISANAVAVHVKTTLRERLFAHIQELGPAYTRGEGPDNGRRRRHRSAGRLFQPIFATTGHHRIGPCQHSNFCFSSRLALWLYSVHHRAAHPFFHDLDRQGR